MSWSNALSRFLRAITLRAEDGTEQGGLAAMTGATAFPTDVPLGTLGITPPNTVAPGVATSSLYQYLGTLPDPVWLPVTQHLTSAVLSIRFNNVADGSPETWPAGWASVASVAESYRLVGVLTTGTNDASAFTISNGTTTLATVSTNTTLGNAITLQGVGGVDLSTVCDQANPLTVAWSDAGVGNSPDLIVMLAPVLSST